MAREYQAFISYRHAEADSRVAAEVQRSLEHFHIPLDLRSQTGFKSLAPVFRDKEELPVTSELAHDITEALENARRLIVICSPRTAESMWVQREIETFLKTHEPSEILTVLAEGEPGEVIPEILLNQKRTVVLEDGSTQEAIVAVEPLSCDFRSPHRREHRSEVTRLAAAILGVPYDALARRQQRYRRRIAAAAALAASAVMAYGTWSLVTIRRSYREIQASQSTALVRDALELYGQGDNLAAIELALAALPAEGSERPLVPSAELALQKVSHAYVPPSTSESDLPAAKNDYGVLRTIDTRHDVSRMVISPDETCVATLSARGDLTCWRIEDGAELCSVNTDFGIQDMVFLDDERLVVLLKDGVGCLSLESGEAMWDAFTEGDASFRPWSTQTADTGALLSEQGSRDSLLSLGVDEKSTSPVVLGSHAVYLLDPDTGARRAAVPLDGLEGERTYLPVLSGFSFVGTGGGICAFNCSTGLDETNPLTLVNIEAGEARLSETSFAQVNAIKVRSSGEVLVSSSTLDGPSSIAREEYNDGFAYAWTVPYTQRLTCLNGKTGATIWSQDLALSHARRNVTILEAPVTAPDGTMRDCVIWCGADTCAWFDAKTGEPLGKNTVPASFVRAWLGPAREKDHGIERVEGCLEDGQYVSCLLDTGESLSAPCFADSAHDAAPVASDVLVATGMRVMHYGSECCDRSWQPLEGGHTRSSNCMITQAGVCTYDANGSAHAGVPTVELFDAATGELRWSTPLCEEGALFNPEYAGTTADGSRLVFFLYGSQEPSVVEVVSLEDGSLESWPLRRTATDALTGERHTVSSYSTQTPLLTGSDKLVVGTSAVADGIVEALVVVDLATHKQQMWPLPDEMNPYKFSADPYSDRVLLGSSSEATDTEGDTLCDAVLFNTATGELVQLPEPLTMNIYALGDLDVLWGEDGKLYAKGVDRIACYEPAGTERFSIDTRDLSILGMRLTRDALELCVSGARDNQILIRRYDKMSGRELGSYEFDAGLEGYAVSQMREGHANVYWTEVGQHSTASRGTGLTVLRLDNVALVLDDAGGVHQTVRNCVGYDAQTDNFLVCDEEGAMGLVGRYDLDELLQRGRDLLGTSHMSAERRTEYGLE